MKTIRLQAKGLGLGELLREGEGGIVLLEVGGADRFALVPVDGPDGRDGLADAEREVRGLLNDGGRLARHSRRLDLDDESLTLKRALLASGDDTAVFLTRDGRLRFALLPLDAGTPQPREKGRRQRPERSSDSEEVDGFTTTEWVAFPAAFLVFPIVSVIGSSVLYYWWRQQKPNKAVLVNILGFAAFGLHVLVFLAFLAFTHLPARGKPNRPKTIQPPPASKEPPPGLVAHWPFNEVRGNQAIDISHNRIVATLRGNAPFWAPKKGVREGGLRLDGFTNYCDLGSSKALNFAAGQGFCISVWIVTVGRDGTILSFRNGNDPGAEVSLTIAGGVLVAMVREDGGEALGPARIRGDFVNNSAWQHICLVREAAGARMRLYQNGKEHDPIDLTQAGGAGPITTDLRTLGCDPYRVMKGFPGQGKPYLAVLLDDLCIYNRAPDARELKALMAGGPPPLSR
jgi:hypothetical protein